MSQTSSDCLGGNLSLSSFSGNPSRSSGFSSPGSEDSDGSNSSDDDTPCSAILDSLDTSACGSCQLQSRDPACRIKKWKDLSSRGTSPEHETTPSFPNRNSGSRLRHLRKKLQKSPSSTSSSNNEEIKCTKNRMDLSLSLSENSDASFSLPSPITCTSTEISTASLLASSAAAQYQPSSSLYAEDTDISFKSKAKVYSKEKNERKPEADSQDPFCSESKESNILTISHDDIPKLSPTTENLRKGSEERFTVSPLLLLSMQEHEMDLPQNLLGTSLSLPQSKNLYKDDKEELVTELPSTSSFQADEEIEATEPFLNLPKPPSRGQPCNPGNGSTCSPVKSLQVLNTSTVSFQPMNNSIFVEAEAVWTAPCLALPFASPGRIACTAQSSSVTTCQLSSARQSINSDNGLLTKNKEVSPPSDISFLAMKKKNLKIPEQETNSSKRLDSVFELRNAGPHLERVQNSTRNDETSSRMKVGSLKLATEAKNNVVRSAEQSMVKNIRTYYIKKIQEMEARHKKQLADVKQHLCSGEPINRYKKLDKKSRKEGNISSERRPLVDYVKKSLKIKRDTMKDSFQQTDASSHEYALGTFSSNLTNHNAKLKELENYITKLTEDNMLQEQVVNRLKDQLQHSTTELAKARQELSSKVSVLSDSPKTQQQFDHAIHQKLLRSLEASQVKSIQLQNQVDNLQFENENLKLQLSTTTCMTEGSSYILTKYSHLSRKICALEQRALRREEDVQTKIIEIQRKTAAENQRLQHLHEEEIREKNEKLAVLRTKLECLTKRNGE